MMNKDAFAKKTVERVMQQNGGRPDRVAIEALLIADVGRSHRGAPYDEASVKAAYRWACAELNVEPEKKTPRMMNKDAFAKKTVERVMQQNGGRPDRVAIEALLIADEGRSHRGAPYDEASVGPAYLWACGELNVEPERKIRPTKGLKRTPKYNRYFCLVSGRPGAFQARIPDIPGCAADGNTREEIFRNAQEALRHWVQGAIADDQDVPYPRNFDEIASDPDIAQALRAGDALVALPLLIDTGSSVKINLSVDPYHLEAIDAEVARLGVSRSAFMSSAALEKIRASV